MKDVSSRITWREGLFHALLLVVLLAFVFPGAFLRGEMISPGYVLYDMLPWNTTGFVDWPNTENSLANEFLTVFTGWYKQTQTCLENGEWPLWNNLELTGLPLLANYQSAVFYPPRLLHSLFEFHLANTLFILLKVWLCGATAYLCARGFKFTPGIARFVSIAFMLSMYVMTWSYWCEPDAAAWLPIVLLGVEYLLEGRYRRGFCTALIGGVLILICGHPETAFTMGLGTGLYFALRLLVDRRWGARLWKPAGLAVAFWAIALLVCAAQILPFLEYLVHSYGIQDRGHLGMEDFTTALTAGSVLQLWVPRFYGMTATNNYWGHWNSNYTTLAYFGIVVWCALSLLISRADPNPKRRAQILCLLAATTFSLLMCFSHPLTDYVKQLPVMNSLWDIYHVAFPVFTMPLLAAFGLERWFSRPRRIRELRWYALLMLLIGAPMAGLYFFHRATLALEGQDRYLLIQVLIAGILAVLCLIALIGNCIRHNPKLWIALFAVLIAGDLIIATRGLHPTTPRDRLWPDIALTRYFQEMDPPPRVAIMSAGILPGLMQWYGIEQWRGYDGIYPRRIMYLWQTLSTDLWYPMEPVCSIKYYLHIPHCKPGFPRDERGGWKYLDTIDGLEVYENLWAYPRAFLVGRVNIVPDIDDLFAILADPDYNPREVALLEAPLPANAPAPNAASDTLGTATVTKRTATHVTIHVQANDNAVLVLTDQYYPGWNATIDGQPAEIFPTYYLFRGILVPKGTHEVQYTYFPWSFRIGLAISTLTLLTGLATALILLIRRPRIR
ncbi:MAG: YfhO family protein [Candidatus Hydrogenedentes bacterium]|nr:YfhO family protein [Candidatus Hydrogenedentota bacterium]